MVDSTIVVLVHGYPVEGETFFETELIYLTKKFKSIILINTDSDCSEIPAHFNVFKDVKVLFSKNSSNLRLKFFIPIIPFVLYELKYIFGKADFFKNVRILVGSTLKALKLCAFLEQAIKVIPQGKIYFYTYWLSEYSLSALLIKKKYPSSVVFSRAHAWDIYEFRHNPSYLPFRRGMLKKTLTVFFISDHAMRYAQYHYGLKSGTNQRVSYLGSGGGLKKEHVSNEVFTIVSCSSLIHLKRIDLIIEVISELNFPVKWVHIGSGTLMTEMAERARMLLDNKSNLTYEFTGYMRNNDILKYYQTNQVDLFINLSQFEGIPVSMMEAMSYGIPVLATNVGGVAELVTHEVNGILVPPDSPVGPGVQEINKLYNLPKNIRDEFSKNAFQTWNYKFNAEKNYVAFVNEILSLNSQ